MTYAAKLFLFAGPKAQAILEALKLPAATQSITLRMTRGEFVEITCTYTPEDLDELVPHLQTMGFASDPPGELDQADDEQQQANDIKDPPDRRGSAWITPYLSAVWHRCVRGYHRCLQWMVRPFAQPIEKHSQGTQEYRSLEEFIDWSRYSSETRRRAERGDGMPPVFHFKPGFEFHGRSFSAEVDGAHTHQPIRGGTDRQHSARPTDDAAQ